MVAEPDLAGRDVRVPGRRIAVGGSPWRSGHDVDSQGWGMRSEYVRIGTWPRLQRTDLIGDVPRCSPPIDLAILAFQPGCLGCGLDVLRLPDRRDSVPIPQEIEGRCDGRDPQHGEACFQLRGVFLGINFQFPLRQDGASVQPGCHVNYAYSRLGLTVEQGPGDGSGPPICRKQRPVEIDATQARALERFRREDLAIVAYDQQVDMECAQVPVKPDLVRRGGLLNRQTEARSGIPSRIQRSTA